jgi:tRNA(Ile)-lysidine synthase
MLLVKVRKIIKQHNLINKGDKIAVGVSGGPDSVALLFLLNALKKELRLTLHIAHLDHMLRKDSRKDREFVEKLAKQLNIPISTAQISVRRLARKGSLEEIARNARLGFLFKVARDIKADKIALGHNLDDQAETVLMRILRGSGLYGLSGILPKRKIAGFTIIRPLVEIKRKEIDSYLKRKKIKPRMDASNLEDIYLRNRIRNKLMPFLEKEYNKNIKEILANLAQSAGSDYDYLQSMAQRSMKGMRTKINLDRFLRLHPAIQRIIVRLAISNIRGNTRKIDFRHIREIEDLILNRPVNSIVDLPRGIALIKKKKSLLFYLRKFQ